MAEGCDVGGACLHIGVRIEVLDRDPAFNRAKCIARAGRHLRNAAGLALQRRFALLKRLAGPPKVKDVHVTPRCRDDKPWDGRVAATRPRAEAEDLVRLGIRANARLCGAHVPELYATIPTACHSSRQRSTVSYTPRAAAVAAERALAAAG